MKTDFYGVVLPDRKKSKKKKFEGTLDLFNMPDQNKYPGPKHVPDTSVSAYREEIYPPIRNLSTNLV